MLYLPYMTVMKLSKTTREQTAECKETISQGTHFSKAAKGDVKLHKPVEKETFSYTFCVQAVCLMVWIF